MNLTCKKSEDWLRDIAFSVIEVVQAMEKDRMLLLDLDLTPNCLLNRRYCDRVADRLVDHRKELNLKRRTEIIIEAREMGCQAVEIPGAGKPLYDPNFLGYFLYGAVTPNGANS